MRPDGSEVVEKIIAPDAAAAETVVKNTVATRDILASEWSSAQRGDQRRRKTNESPDVSRGSGS
jgi:hypothetical protein